MTKWDAPCELLVELGYGSHSHANIPDDFLTRRGPDSKTWAPHREPRQKRQTFRQRRAMFEAARDEAQG